MIKCITFDLDDTLWKIEPVILRAEVKFYEWLKDKYPVVTEKFNIESLRNLMKQTLLENQDIKYDLTKVRLLAYEKIKNTYNLPDNMPNEGFNLFMLHRNKVTLFDGVERILSELKSKYILGTITNGNASLGTIGISNYFNFEIKAEDVGYMKPSSEIFYAAIKEADCLPTEILHVGDSYEKDIIGAMSVNMSYLWVNHNNDIEKNIDKKNIIKSILQIPVSLDN